MDAHNPPPAIDDLLAALADPARRRLLDDLAARGEATATALARDAPITRQAVAKHLAILELAGLVASHRQGREVRYTLRPAALDPLSAWLTTRATLWDTRLAALKHLAESSN